MKWAEIYKEKRVGIEHVLNLIHSDMTVVVGMAPAEPQLFLSKLHEASPELQNVNVFTCLNMQDYPCFLSEGRGRFRNNCWFYTKGSRNAVATGLKTITYVPNNLHQAAINLIQDRNIDIYIGVASPMDKNGYFTLLGMTYEKDVLENADLVILEVNPNSPRIHGDAQVHISDIDYVVEADYPIPEVSLIEPSEIERRIGEYISHLIEDGSTLQIGIGGIPNAVALFLKDKKDLGIHTEMLTESMVDLFEAGVITNKRKTLWPGKFVCTFVYGTKRLYEFVDDNPAIMMLRGSYVNDPYIIAQNEQMVSINTALTVDLTGNVCSEALGIHHFSGTGGQLDTHRGAIMSKGGKGIIALRSTVKNNTISTIVPFLPKGSPVTVPRQEVDYVITEYGVAHLRGKSVYERIEELIKIAHPNFKSQLRKEIEEVVL
ncbi:MAG: acetyl-CoA hydrolase/transferase family protein [Thermotogae bacterium]|nr:acetyl-CoA hydrolase/transferase family protein [Thermotogota bacterium]